ncbi:hypothetical protein EJ110_NYTH54582 [Nymphaea thermarum]|nr:hypothetical protein EJ110_NYTH54582 [Nymphaea thermarum]
MERETQLTANLKMRDQHHSSLISINNVINFTMSSGAVFAEARVCFHLPFFKGNARNGNDMVLVTDGLAKRPAQHGLSLIFNKFKPSIGFVLDSMITTHRVKVIMAKYHTYRYLTNAEGPDGVVRILCMWNEEEMEASHVVVDQNWVGVSFCRLADSKAFVVFGVYLPPRFEERLQNFYQLEALVSRVEGPVLLIGDFNAMLSSYNKSGSAPSASPYLSFSCFIYACRLKLVDDRNKRFMWLNHKQGQDSVQSKLDWCLLNDEWITRFGGEGSLKVQTYASWTHCALIYQIRDASNDQKGKKPFRLFKPWLMDQKGKEVMFEAWRMPLVATPYQIESTEIGGSRME